METIETFRVKYQSFIGSNLTVQAFCEQNGIGRSHFFYWQAKLRRSAMCEASSSPAPNGEFIPVSMNNRSGKIVLVGRNPHGTPRSVQNAMPQPSSSPSCEITYPNGVTVRLSGEVSATVLGQLIMLSR